MNFFVKQKKMPHEKYFIFKTLVNTALEKLIHF